MMKKTIDLAELLSSSLHQHFITKVLRRTSLPDDSVNIGLTEDGLLFEASNEAEDGDDVLLVKLPLCLKDTIRYLEKYAAWGGEF